ncbi:MAG: conjugal transfer protein TrbE [Deltaproteobacteria bacterium]|jgi:type IV secretion system protein VirB4|nr:conjugal transfer protein TrbE [Deltaproteobacteria bacterium]
MLSLKGFRSKAVGLTDYLPYATMIAPGVILLKNGALMAAWEFFGVDSASLTEADMDQISWLFSQMLRELDTGWMMHVDAFRKPTSRYPEPGLSHFPDRISQMIDDERRAFYTSASACYQTNTVFALTFLPPAYMIKHNYVEGLNTFNETINKIDRFMAGIPGFSLERLTEYKETDDNGVVHTYSTLLSYIQSCITGKLHPVLMPENPVGEEMPYNCLDYILGSEDVTVSEHLNVGDHFVKVIAIDGLPGSSRPDMLGVLDKFPLTYRFNSRFIFLDRFDAEKKIVDSQKGWAQQTMSFMDKYFERPNAKINQDAVNMVGDAEDALTELRSGEARFGYLTSVIVIHGDDLEIMRRNAVDLISEIEARGFTARYETYNTMEAWLGSHPGNGIANIRRPVITSKNLPHLLPLSGVWSGLDYCPCPFYPENSPPLMVCTTDGSTPFRLNLHYGDLGHTLIFGPTGAGKSTLLALIAASFKRYPEASIFAFDKGMSLYPLCAATGGDHYDLGGSSNLCFAPLQRIDEDDEEFSWAAGWVATLAALQKLELLPKHREAINSALSLLRHQPAENRSLTSLTLYLQDHDLKQALNFFTGDRPMGKMLDSKEDNLQLSNFSVFEIESLMEMGNETLIPVLTYLFRRIKKSLYGQPAMIILDEAWIMLGDPVFRAEVREWLKTMRKANCVVVMATQSLADAADSGIMHVLEESCPSKIFLPNFQANSSTQLPHYMGLNLNETQINIIRNSIPKQDYYITNPAGRRLVQLTLTKKQLAFLGSSSKENIARIKELEGLFGQDWPEKWLEELAC